MGQPHVEDRHRLGDFEIIREIGRGGMGIVYEARQVSLNRKVALKVLAGSLGLTSKAVQRFHREAEAAAKLHHTNIVPVYATGEQDGTHFYAMELIEGPSLDHVIKQIKASRSNRSTERSPPTGDSGSAALASTGPYVPETSTPASLNASTLSSDNHYFDTVARLIAEVADALGYAHQEGVIHRDIKPSNLLLSPAGRLSINDFGLARMLEQPGMTISGEFVGTPAYMSPEQIAVGRIALDHRTDIYSLGATLYELLTLEPPHKGKSREQVLTQIVQKEPKPPRRLDKKIPVDLETICLKCLEKDPDRRYQSGGELAEDLRRYVNRFAIAARRAGPVQRLLKWVKRRPAMAASIGFVFVAFCVTVAFAFEAQHERRQRLIEQEEAKARLHDEQEQAHLQLLEEKVRNAYLVAAGGDLKKTEEAIKEIETLGASSGQVRLLRGIVAYFRSDSVTAISELEQAVKLLPGSIAARALLASSYDGAGNYTACVRTLLEVTHLSPSTPEDYLFGGYAKEMYDHAGSALEDLNQGIRMRDSPLGRALRAIVQANRAVDSGNLQVAEAALADARAGKGMLPDNSLVLNASLYAHIIAHDLYQDAKLIEPAERILDEARRDVDALEPFIELSDPAWHVWLFYESTGRLDRALQVAQRCSAKYGKSLATYNCAVDLYQQGRFAEALKCIPGESQSDLDLDIMRAFILAELPDGSNRALQEHQRLSRKYRGTGGAEWRALTTIPLLLGNKHVAVRALQDWRMLLDGLSEKWLRFYEAKRLFSSGKISEQAYLAKAGSSRFRQLDAHYDIGLFRLAEGDRKGASEEFERAVATHAYWACYVYFPSKMLLSRLRNDPNWPWWIPPKTGQTKPSGK